MRVGTQPVGNVSDLLNQVANLTPGVPAELVIWRQQAQMSLRLTPAERPAPKRQAR
jgi:S1-C subfamily serine protease